MKNTHHKIRNLSIACVFGAALPAITAVQAAEPGLVIAYKGNTKGATSEMVTPAAKEAHYYLQKVLGKPLAEPVEWSGVKAGNPILLITEAKYLPPETAKLLDGKKKDAFIIKYPFTVDGKTVCLLVAHDEWGYDFPVYYFLNHFAGVDWVGPGEDGEVITANPAWQLPEKIDVLENPDFEHRLWGDIKFKMARPLLAGSNRMGFHHALGVIFSPEKYARTDPDVYPLIDGKRKVPDPTQAHTAGWQPCVGNPKSQNIAVQYVLEAFKKSDRSATVSLTVNDGAGNHCMCDLCRALDAKDAFKDPLKPNLSDRYFRFYNLVVERALKENTNVQVAVLAYGPCSAPPVETKINDRIVIFFATGDPDQFAGKGGGVSVYQYHLDNAYPTIRHYPHMLADYIRDIKKRGGRGYYAQIEHNWAAGGPKTYVLAHLLWRTDSDVDELLDRYMRLAFGEQAMAAMRSYFDRWEEIYTRECQDHPPFQTINGWTINHLNKMKYFKWEDIYFFDVTLAVAQKAKKNPAQAKRLNFFVTYYQYLRANAVQYLMTQDLKNQKWVGSHSAAEVVETVGQAVALTKEFDRLWESAIAKDRTGWLLNQKQKVIAAVEQGQRFEDSLLVDPIRAAVEADMGTGIEAAFAQVSAEKTKAEGKDAALAFWTAQLEKYPALKMYIVPEINLLKGIIPQNLLVNGRLEDGTPGNQEPGNPPQLPGWWFYDRVGMVQGAKAVYDWRPKEGRPGKCLGFGAGKYPGVRTFVRLQPGRYRFSLWYQTENRDDPVTACLYKLAKTIQPENLTSDEAVKKVNAADGTFFKFLMNRYPATNGEWRQVRETFAIAETEGLCLTFEPFNMKKDAWVWINDVELVKLY